MHYILSFNYDGSNIYILHRFEHEKSYILPPFVPIIYIIVDVCAVYVHVHIHWPLWNQLLPIHIHSVKQYLDVKTD